MFQYAMEHTRHTSLNTITLEEMRKRHPELINWADPLDEIDDVCEDKKRRDELFQETKKHDGIIQGHL